TIKVLASLRRVILSSLPVCRFIRPTYSVLSLKAWRQSSRGGSVEVSGRGIKRVGLNRVAARKRGYGDLSATEQHKAWCLVGGGMAGWGKLRSRPADFL